MFKFSATVPLNESVELIAWLRHFEQLKIAAALVKADDGFSIWKTGSAIVGGGKNRVEHIEDQPHGELIATVHGFEREWTAAQNKTTKHRKRAADHREIQSATLPT